MTSTAVDKFLRAIENAAIPGCDAWSADAMLDATVLAVVRRPRAPRRAAPVPVAGVGELIEYTLSWQENGVPHAAHHMPLLTVRDDRIVSDTVMCRGRWPARLLAEMEAADMEAADA